MAMARQLDIPALLDVFQRVRGLLALPENDFSWSSWTGQSDALDEIDEIIRILAKNGRPDALTMRVLFAPTGPLQEVSISSGWSTQYMQLASEFDQAVGKEDL